jgi:hypothetical protein
MAVQFANSWSPTTLGVAHTALRDRLDAGTGAARITIHNDGEELLATIPLTEPCGTVNVDTGYLTFTAAGPGTGVLAGNAYYASIRDGDGNVHRSLLCQAGSSAMSNKCVINVLVVEVGTTITLISFEVT